MPKTFRLPKDKPLLDIVSYGGGGQYEDIRLTPAHVDHIRRTVQRTPEVMVKVLSRASNDLKAVGKHIDYISRKGDLELEADDEMSLRNASGKALLEDWDLDVDDIRRQSTLSIADGRQPPKLVHKLMFSMPPGTPPESVLGAVRIFAREEFWGRHRYAFVLHTDEAHPHVHLVLKAMSEQGVRLNIKKATLRHWRSEFARRLRLLGVAANATERAVRGETRTPTKDGVYRASLRGDSRFLQARAMTFAEDLKRGDSVPEPGRRKLRETRAAVERGWLAAASYLKHYGHPQLASDVLRFVGQLPPPRTDRERVIAELSERLIQSRGHTR